MGLPLRTSLLLVVLATSLVPLAGFAHFELSEAREAAQTHEATRLEAEALAVALRADAAAAEGGEPLASLPADALLVARDGSWRAPDGTTGASPALATTMGQRLSGTAEAPDPRSGDTSRLAWARAPAAGSTVVLVRDADAGAPVALAPFGVVIAFLVSGAVLIAAAVTSRVLRPLHRLERASRRLAGGAWKERAPIAGSREVRDLARSFNAMADDLARQHAELESYANHLDALVAERTRSLVESAAYLEEINFTLAHELREPLRSMRMTADAFLHDVDPEEAPLLVSMLRDKVARLERIHLDLMRYDELARQDAPMAPVQLSRAAEAAAARVREEHGADALQLESGALPEVVGNEALLTEVFVEALRNAFTHGAVSGHARVRLNGRTENGRAIVTIDDDGPGVPPDRREDAFHLFQRLGSSTGTGVGLAIVRRLMARHDGRATLEDAPGGGSRLVLELPVEGPAPRTPGPETPSGRTF